MDTKLKRLEQVLLDFYRREEIPRHLSDSVIYSLMGGGKRIRPLLFLEMLEAFGVPLINAHYIIAAGIEMIHTGSLIHDDLPVMDNDDYRRGKLTNHKKFDESTATLAGDALFLDPYYLFATCGLPEKKIVWLVRELSYASGSLGMVAGQILDMDGEGKSLSPTEIEQLHQLKTGRMLAFPFIASGIIAEKSEVEIQQLRTIGQKFGLAFQIRDDILDVIATFDDIGKTPGKDLLEKKSTYVSLLGLEGAKRVLNETLLAIKNELFLLMDFKGDKIFEIVETLQAKI